MSENTERPEQHSNGHPIVGIGASAGGVQALQQFFAHLPEDSGMAFVVILHLLREKESTLADLIQQHVSMPVQQVTERVMVKPDHVYVIPPDSDLSMTNGYLSLTQRKDSATRHAPIDLFFRTLAQTHGANMVGIILSGSGSDGTLGLKAIKEAGGLALVQDPDEAAYAGMPRSAIATGLVDRVLPTHEMAEKLVEYQQQAQRIQLPDEPGALPDDTTATLLKILTQLRSRIGHDFSHYKRATLLRRIARRMQINQIETLPAYLTFLREHAEETKALFKNLLISVTNFFRDPDAFAALEQVIPKLFEGKSRSDQVRVWVPGCATGEEAYSLAILLAEHADTLDDPPTTQIFATDIDEDALTTARTGTYSAAIAADVSQERLKRFFTRDADTYQIRKDLHENILFATHNLLGDPPFSNLDLIACRNVLIYLMRDIHERTFELFHYALRPGGYLLLGTAESAADLDLFEAIDKQQRLYQRQNVPSLPPHLPEMPLLHPNDGQQRQRRTPERQPPAGDMHRRLLEQYAPPSVLVNSHYNIVHISKTAGRYLEMAGGEPTMNVLKVVRQELQGPLHTTLYQALHDGQATVERGIQVRFNGDIGLVDLIVRPTGDSDGFALVIFSEIALTEAHDDARPPEDNPLLRHLESELQHTKERLQVIVEEFDSSREEMKAQNEELQSVNEEYKTTTEELETSKEELQSVNEELQTVNQELKNKVDEVNEVNSDLQNLIASTEIGTLFLDRNLHVQRFTPPTTDLFNLVPTDQGRPLLHITHQLDFDRLVPDAQQVLRTLVPIEKEIQSTDGKWFLVTLRPYRTVDDKIEGVVITFVDFTRRHQAEEEVRQGEEQYDLVINSIREYAIFTMDEDGLIATWNAEAEKVLGWSEAEIIGQPIATIFTEDDRAAGVPDREMETARQHDRAADDRWHLHKDGSRFWANGVLSAMYDADGALRGFVKILRDHTARKKAEEELRRVTEQARHQLQIFDDTLSALSDFVYVFDREGRFISVNQPLLDLWGLTLDEAIGKTFYELPYPEDLAAKHHRQIQQVIESGESIKDENYYTNPAGETRYYEYIFTPVFGENDEVTTVAGSTRDITERKASEIALQKATERLQVLTETVPDILFATDADINVEYLSPHWTEFTGTEPEAGFGTSWRDFLHEADRARVRQKWHHARETSTSYEDRQRLLTTDGSYRWVLVRARPIRSDAGEVTRWFGTVTDINEQVAAEEQIQQLNETLEERVRLRTEQVRSLTASLTLAEQHERQRIAQILHDDLQQMLYGLDMAVQQLRKRNNPDQQKRFLDQMDEILDQAIDTTRSLTVELSPPVLQGEGLAEALQWLAVRMEQVHNLEVTVHAEGSSQAPSEDQHILLYQMVRELLFNIVKHAEVNQAHIDIRTVDHQLIIAVSDEGQGFNPDEKMTGTVEGTGFGLASIQERLDIFGGHLTIDSEPNKGTCITITTPTKAGDAT